ncbi:MAG: hypothetical protein E4H13_03395 [Calditrichales bacterium]|nr:MAG: hypothetical protein E4H13_03395 [Calditrichales bacterium]
MDTFWQKLKLGISDGYHTLSVKTDELTRMGRLKLEMIAAKRDIEKAFIELGGRVYHSFQEKSEDHILSDQTILKLINDIERKEVALADLEEKVDIIRNQKDEKSNTAD